MSVQEWLMRFWGGRRLQQLQHILRGFVVRAGHAGSHVKCSKLFSAFVRSLRLKMVLHDFTINITTLEDHTVGREILRCTKMSFSRKGRNSSRSWSVCRGSLWQRIAVVPRDTWPRDKTVE